VRRFTPSDALPSNRPGWSALWSACAAVRSMRAKLIAADQRQRQGVPAIFAIFG
jgi:hypothetical protein